MHNGPRLWFASGILAILSWQAAANESFPGINLERPLTIRIYNLADVPSRTLNDALKDAARILATAGIDPIWELGRNGAHEAQIVDLSRPLAWKNSASRARAYLVVEILGGVPAAYFPGALGYALPDAQIGVNATVFYGRVEQLNDKNVINLATVLGHVMAHEIGHVLLGSTEHDRAGIMKSSWTKDDFEHSVPGAAEFTDPQCAAIRKREGRIQR